MELHVRHPRLGWMELGGAGLFRPEVTLPLGVKVPVIAWGLVWIVWRWSRWAYTISVNSLRIIWI